MRTSASKRRSKERSPEISIVIPLYNEEENLPELYRRLTQSLQALGVSYELVFVNDGSRDGTPAMIDALHQQDLRVVGIHLSRNFGHQAAISAGLDYARGRAVILMDGDLQDPPEVLDQFVKRWQEGYEVVYAIRAKRKEGLLKRTGYFWFYRLLRLFSDLDIPLDSGDFSLLDRRIVKVMRRLPERIRFIRGLRTFAGFRQIGVAYERAGRQAGTPKYTFRSLLGLAVNGLISFSNYPLRLVTYLGLASAGLAAVLAIWALIDAFYKRTAPQGWASTIIVVLFMSAVQMLSLGIMGEYIRCIFIESKGRPTYIVGRVVRSRRGTVAAHTERRTGLIHTLEESKKDSKDAEKVDV
ncbi:MAG TPA: glycosyltransferase family 2 protein [Gemmataceae bacterium]|nr:glycosyltransferase family 2 protein [Gemmataceae bacterium]